MQSGRICLYVCKSRLYRAFCKLNRYYRSVRAFLDKPDDAFINFQRAGAVIRPSCPNVAR